VIKLIALLKRKPGMSEEDFHTHWRGTHGPLVASTKSGQHALRYEQNHRAGHEQDRLGAGDYDGVTIQWFTSMADFQASIAEDDYAQIAADMDEFLDMDKLVFLLTEDAEVIWDNLAP
jgi:uncharacterized protein (TIGR02118 family)